MCPIPNGFRVRAWIQDTCNEQNGVAVNSEIGASIMLFLSNHLQFITDPTMLSYIVWLLAEQ
jgi:hypothetical protein